jgi:WD40 repeat protein
VGTLPAHAPTRTKWAASLALMLLVLEWCMCVQRGDRARACALLAVDTPAQLVEFDFSASAHDTKTRVAVDEHYLGEPEYVPVSLGPLQDRFAGLRDLLLLKFLTHALQGVLQQFQMKWTGDRSVRVNMQTLRSLELRLRELNAVVGNDFLILLRDAAAIKLVYERGMDVYDQPIVMPMRAVMCALLDLPRPCKLLDVLRFRQNAARVGNEVERFLVAEAPRWASLPGVVVDPHSTTKPLVALENTFYAPVDVFKGGERKEFPRAVAFNAADPNFVVLCNSKGVREIDVEGTLRYRKRSSDLATLEDDELTSWKQCIHRYDGAVKRDRERVMAEFSTSERAATLTSLGSEDFQDAMYPTPIRLLRDVLNGSEEAWDTRTRVLGKESLMFQDDDVYKKFSHSHFGLIDAKSTKQAHDRVCTAVCAHPVLPMYVTADTNGNLLLWRFGWPNAVGQFSFHKRSSVQVRGRANVLPGGSLEGGGGDVRRSPSGSKASQATSKVRSALSKANQAISAKIPSRKTASGGEDTGNAADADAKAEREAEEKKKSTKGLVSKIRFSSRGDRLAVSLVDGEVFLWVLSTTVTTAQDGRHGQMEPILHWLAHDKRATDLCFLTPHSNLVACSGASVGGENIKIVDLHHNREVEVLSTHSAGASALCFVEGRQWLVSGGAKGEVHVASVSSAAVATPLTQFSTKREKQVASPVSALCVDSSCQELSSSSILLFVGNQNGCVSIYDVCDASNVHLMHTLDDLFASNTFFNHPCAFQVVSVFGVSDIAVHGSHVLIAGSSGRLKYLRRKMNREDAQVDVEQ